MSTSHSVTLITVKGYCKCVYRIDARFYVCLGVCLHLCTILSFSNGSFWLVMLTPEVKRSGTNIGAASESSFQVYDGI
jgi:hypothetical protein